MILCRIDGLRFPMPSKWLHPKNTGWTDVDYDFGLPQPDATALAQALNAACHVFYYHGGGGIWQNHLHGKQHYASLIAAQIKAHPGLTHRLLASGDRVIQMLTYRAVEMLEHPDGR
ncbi:MAG: hypothetical protein FWD68_00865 [Alphaproteobacteria bacterium]|nr:hypothetical protein [Alphaproteobacteria bacterium]